MGHKESNQQQKRHAHGLYGQTSNVHVSLSERSREKRQSTSQYLGPRTTCQMMVVADYRFFQNMGGSSASQTASYMVSYGPR